MKTKMNFFLPAVVVLIFCTSVHAQLPHSDGRDLFDLTDKSLTGIKQVYVSVIRLGNEPNQDGLVWNKLRTEIIDKLAYAGIKTTPDITAVPLGIAELRVKVEMLKLAASQQYVFRIQTSLARAVTLPRKRRPSFKVDVWSTEPQMQAITIKDMAGTVTKVVSEQVEIFSNAYLAANPRRVRPAKAVQREQLSKPARRKAAEKTNQRSTVKYQYVASKNSKVFHKPACIAASTIKPSNFGGYNSRDEAVKAGKRPCKRCKP